MRPEPDAVSKWISTHQDELAKYRGCRVAIHPEKGVVAYGEDIQIVYAVVAEMGLLDEVVFDSVPVL